MSDRDYHSKLMELDRLLNDPDAKMEAAKVWSLVAEISQQSQNLSNRPQPRR